MNWESALSGLWSAANSPAGITLLGSLLLWVLARLYSRRPLWQQYEGAVISAVKEAEKAIPDGTPHAGLARLDLALRTVVAVYEQARGRVATAAEVAELRNGVQLVHSDLEQAGTL
jgi:hypothetical protein